MSHYLNQTAKVVLDRYKGDLDNLRKEADHDPAKVREAVKAFKVGLCLNSYCPSGCTACLLCSSSSNACRLQPAGSNTMKHCIDGGFM